MSNHDIIANMSSDVLLTTMMEQISLLHDQPRVSPAHCTKRGCSVSKHVIVANMSGDALLSTMLEHSTCSVIDDKHCNHIVKAAGVTAKIEPFFNDDSRISDWFLHVSVDDSPTTAIYHIDDEGLVDRAIELSKKQEKNSATRIMQLAMAKLFKE